jgi:hypothetical protein
MKLSRDIWPPYQPLTPEELEHLEEIEQTAMEDRCDEARKGES